MHVVYVQNEIYKTDACMYKCVMHVWELLISKSLAKLSIELS
jgi:hypothetical protein